MSAVGTTFRASVLSSLALVACGMSVAFAQLKPPEVPGLRGAPFKSQNPPPDLRSYGQGPEWDAKPPPGVQPLPIDSLRARISTRIGSTGPIRAIGAAIARGRSPTCAAAAPGSSTSDPRIGKNPPVTARWGDCSKDWSRENIVSPYRFKSAKEHYAALLADAKSRGGPTKHTYETMPKWDGVYGEYLPDGRRVWNYGRATQVPTFLSILAPEYQQRMVRQLYHEGVDAAHAWSASYCWPEGFMRQWATGPKPQRIVVTPDVVVLSAAAAATSCARFTSIASSRSAKKFRNGMATRSASGMGMPSLPGRRTCRAWTQHTTWEFSYEFETIEILTPVRDAAGKHLGIDWETVIYDPEALRSRSGFSGTGITKRDGARPTVSAGQNARARSTRSTGSPLRLRPGK